MNKPTTTGSRVPGSAGHAHTLTAHAASAAPRRNRRRCSVTKPASAIHTGLLLRSADRWGASPAPRTLPCPSNAPLPAQPLRGQRRGKRAGVAPAHAPARPTTGHGPTMQRAGSAHGSQPVTTAAVTEVRGLSRLVESCATKLFAPPHRQVRDGSSPGPRSYRLGRSPRSAGLAPSVRCSRRSGRDARGSRLAAAAVNHGAGQWERARPGHGAAEPRAGPGLTCCPRCGRCGQAAGAACCPPYPALPRARL